VRLGADITVFDGLWFPDSDTAAVSFGILGGQVGGALVGLGGLGPSIAYSITDAIIIGARVEIGGTWFDDGAGGDSFIGHLGFLPFFEFNIVGDSAIQPFFGAELGYDYFFGDIFNDDGRFLAGGIGGVHIFATSDFSISPTGHLGFAYNFNNDQAALTWGITLQFLGWIGGDRATISIQG
jgi:hypothetical protein